MHPRPRYSKPSSNLLLGATIAPLVMIAMASVGALPAFADTPAPAQLPLAAAQRENTNPVASSGSTYRIEVDWTRFITVEDVRTGSTSQLPPISYSATGEATAVSPSDLVTSEDFIGLHAQDDASSYIVGEELRQAAQSAPPAPSSNADKGQTASNPDPSATAATGSPIIIVADKVVRHIELTGDIAQYNGGAIELQPIDETTPVALLRVSLPKDGQLLEPMPVASDEPTPAQQVYAAIQDSAFASMRRQVLNDEHGLITSPKSGLYDDSVYGNRLNADLETGVWTSTIVGGGIVPGGSHVLAMRDVLPSDNLGAGVYYAGKDGSMQLFGVATNAARTDGSGPQAVTDMRDLQLVLTRNHVAFTSAANLTTPPNNGVQDQSLVTNDSNSGNGEAIVRAVAITLLVSVGLLVLSWLLGIVHFGQPKYFLPRSRR